MTNNPDQGEFAQLAAMREDLLAELRGRKRGLGILDWLDTSFFMRFLRVLSPIAIVLGITTFMLDLDDVKHDRDARAWRLLASNLPGNSGKIEALDYLNKHNPLAIANPRRWDIPLGPRAASQTDALPEDWVLVADYGPWKSRTPLTGIDLSRKREADLEKLLGPYDDGWLETGKYLSRVNLAGAILDQANMSGAILKHANLSGANLFVANLSGADLGNANLSRADIQYANLSGAYMSSANLSGADLHYTDIRAADLKGADLSRADLRNTKLSGADLSGADLMEADLQGAENLSQSQFDSTYTEDMKNLPEGLVPSPPCKRHPLAGFLIRDKNGNPIRVTEESE